MRVATIDGTRFHDAGASDAQELGDTLAVVVATLRVLTEAGLGVGAALAQLEIRLAATVEQFATIAKFTPVYGVGEIARYPLVHEGSLAVAVLNVVVWSTVFAAGAFWRFRRDTTRV